MSKELLSAKNKTCLMTANDRGKSFVETAVGATVILKGSKHDLSHNCYLCRSTGLFFEVWTHRNSDSSICFPSSLHFYFLNLPLRMVWKKKTTQILWSC